MRKLANLFILLPLAVVLIFLSVANRQPVQFNLDPINAAQSGLFITLPFFAYLFAAFLIGILVGGLVSWFNQGKTRRELREKRSEVHRLARQVEQSEKQAAEQAPEIAPGLPAITSSKAA